MEFHNWKIFDKKGSYLNWDPDPFIKLNFVTDAQNARGAEAYVLTDPSALIDQVVVTNSGFNYDPNNTIAVLTYLFSESSQILTPSEVSINYIDVSVFSPDPATVQGVGSVFIDLSTAFIYPSISYAGSLFLTPVAEGLVETEHLAILQETSTGAYRRPYAANTEIIVRMVNAPDEEIRLFEVDEVEQILEWSDELIFDASIISNIPIVVNIGFRAETEGVFERRLRIYERINKNINQEYLLAEILVNAQSIGQDERFSTILQDVAPAFNPKDFPHLFKRANINEALPDWQLVNQKSRNMVLDYAHITPFIGTYKALINTIKWLGYEDIKIKEWFKNVKENKKISLYVPYEAVERRKTILYFSAEERRHLKKLNELSLVYCINRDTGEIDEWGNPITENCYEYNLDEILIKLYALKIWLEKKVIGVNARIVDLIGEGIYYERFRNLIYATHDYGPRGKLLQSLTPMPLSDNSELVQGDASVYLTLKELNRLKINNYPYRFSDLIQYGYLQDASYFDVCTGTYIPIAADSSLVADLDASIVRVGASFRHPLTIFDINWRLSVEKPESGVLTTDFVTHPLWIYGNTIRFYNIFDQSTLFYDISTNLDIFLEQAYLRDASNDDWNSSIAYSIYKDDSTNSYWLESSTGIKTEFNGYIRFTANRDASHYLSYAYDDNYMVPLLAFENYKYTDISGNTTTLAQKYFLDIIDGKIALDVSLLTPDTQVLYTTQYINFNYDTNLDEQKITLNVVYNSPRFPLAIYDPSIYYYYFSQNLDPSNALIIDNSVYKMWLNHIGDYNIEVFGWDGYNVLFTNTYKDGDGQYEVWTKYPTLLSHIDSSLSKDNVPSAQENYDVLNLLNLQSLYDLNPKPIFDQLIPLQGLQFKEDSNNIPYLEVPSITFFQDLPATNSKSKFYNLTERVTSIDNSTQIQIDPDFVTFLNDDSINVVLFNRGEYMMLEQEGNTIADISNNIITLAQGLPNSFVIDESTRVFVQNDSLRVITDVSNDLPNQQISFDVSGYQFLENQLVGLIISDNSTNYSWGSSFRVLEVSGYTHTLTGNIPEFILADPSRYELGAKHSFSTFSTFQIDVDFATEQNNIFNIYHEDIYYHQYYLDNTFLILNVLFDQEEVIDQWYSSVKDPSLNLISKRFYPYDKAIEIDASTLVIFRAIYDPSDYMLNQKNIWTITRWDDNETIMRVFNETVFYIFDELGTYHVKAEAYDYYGNLRSKTYEGLIKVTEPEFIRISPAPFIDFNLWGDELLKLIITEEGDYILVP